VFRQHTPVRGSDKNTNQFLSAFSNLLFDDLFRQPFYVLLHRVFHFHILVVSSFFECSRLGIEVPVLNEGFRTFYPGFVRRQNRPSSFDLLTHPPPLLLLYASVRRGGEPCGLVRSLPETLRRPSVNSCGQNHLRYGKGVVDHVDIISDRYKRDRDESSRPSEVDYVAVMALQSLEEDALPKCSGGRSPP